MLMIHAIMLSEKEKYTVSYEFILHCNIFTLSLSFKNDLWKS